MGGGLHRLAVLRFALTDVCFWVQSGLALPRHQPNCLKPQIASKAETTRAAHDTFIETLYGPICTVHRFTSLMTWAIATTAKIKAETTA
jgi:hypothetical protein